MKPPDKLHHCKRKCFCWNSAHPQTPPENVSNVRFQFANFLFSFFKMHYFVQSFSADHSLVVFLFCQFKLHLSIWKPPTDIEVDKTVSSVGSIIAVCSSLTSGFLCFHLLKFKGHAAQMGKMCDQSKQWFSLRHNTISPIRNCQTQISENSQPLKFKGPWN